MTKTNNTQAPKPTKPSVNDAENLVAKATGSDDKDWQSHLLEQTEPSFRRLNDEDEPEMVNARKAGLAVLEALAPRDPVEAMLAAQMIVTHNAAMEFAARAINPDQSLIRSEAASKTAHKFLDLFPKQIETLNKYRGKGRQKITVEHVNVEAGGQAIVGNVKVAPKEDETAEGPVKLAHSAEPVMSPLNEQRAPENSIASRKETKRGK